MTHKSQKIFVVTVMWLVVLVPLEIVISNRASVFADDLLNNLFPLFGILSFTILWLHVISGVFEEKLRTLFNFDLYVKHTAQVVFISILAHPLLLFLAYDLDLLGIIGVYGSWPIRLGVTAWLLLITYDVGRLLQKREFFSRHWRKILFISTIGIIVAFFHSFTIGGDLQEGPLRALWIIYGVTAILATIKNFGLIRIS